MGSIKSTDKGLSAIGTSNHERVPWDNKHGNLARDVGSSGTCETCKKHVNHGPYIYIIQYIDFVGKETIY